MDFDFSPEQYMLRDTVRDLLRRECTPAGGARRLGVADRPLAGALAQARRARASSASPSPRSTAVPAWTRSTWSSSSRRRAARCSPSRCSRRPRSAPRCSSAPAPTSSARRWLPRIAAGEATVTVGLAGSPYVADATADLVVLEREGALHAVTQDRLTVQPLRSVDGARRLFSVTAELGDDTVLSTSAADARWAFDHAAAATAAELVGVAGAMLDMTVAYVKQREQFGRRIGSFQAVQHKLAETLLLVDSARAAVYYAAWALANDTPDASIAASVAKAYASDAERRANAEALQLHGGIGFTWEHDLHLWLKRGKALELQYGDADRHRRRIADWIYAPA